MNEKASSSQALSYEHDGLTLGYSLVGGGEPVLFVHGATGTGEFEWGKLAARLSHRFRCVLPDLRGHGRSEFRRSGYTGTAVCADLRRLIEHLNLDQPHIVGFSYGSEISLMLELAEPGTARSLVLVSPGTGRAPDHRLPSVGYLHRIWPTTLQRLHDAHHSPEHWRSLVATLAEDSSTRSELPADVLAGVGCPVLLLAGERDDQLRRSQAATFAQVNPRARYVEIEGAAHAAHLESPARIVQVVGDFLAEVDVERRSGRHDTTKVG
ncbi:alpha/beta hydrolase [Nocardia sp. NBC_00565]|uniref:alpha/beta fold hydrolase n=1 Tax=Nocardia sp. NBC_00565 TaxID=2975993 RepID=UPI002E808ED2|nr:alpha/beta hydrolase [Nocardia sp. NBC_00565]WUC05593.1 alpha/beta hydrolase [Nocardia sp. NBC_00565]